VRNTTVQRGIPARYKGTHLLLPPRTTAVHCTLTISSPICRPLEISHSICSYTSYARSALLALKLAARVGPLRAQTARAIIHSTSPHSWLRTTTGFSGLSSVPQCGESAFRLTSHHSSPTFSFLDFLSPGEIFQYMRTFNASDSAHILIFPEGRGIHPPSRRIFHVHHSDSEIVPVNLSIWLPNTPSTTQPSAP
jgi:hypothetical protein